MPGNDLKQFFEEQNKVLQQRFKLQWHEIEEDLKKVQESVIRAREDLEQDFADKLKGKWENLFNSINSPDAMSEALGKMEIFLNEEADQYVKDEFKKIIKAQLNIDDTEAEEFLKSALGTALPRISPTRLEEILAANTEAYEDVAKKSIDQSLKLSDQNKQEQLMKIALQFAAQEAKFPEHTKSVKDPTWFWQTVAHGNQSWQNFYVAARELELAKMDKGRSAEHANKKLASLDKDLAELDTGVREALQAAMLYRDHGMMCNIIEKDFQDKDKGKEAMCNYALSELYRAMKDNPLCMKHGPKALIQRIKELDFLDPKKISNQWDRKVLQGNTPGQGPEDSFKKFVEEFIQSIPKELATEVKTEPKRKEQMREAVNEHLRKRRKDVNLLHDCFSGACLYEMEKGSKSGTTVYEALTEHLQETHLGSSWKVNVDKLHAVGGKEAMAINNRVSTVISNRTKSGELNRAAPTELSEKKLSYSFDKVNNTDAEVDTTPPTVNILSRNGKVDVEVVGAFSGVVRIPRIDKEFGEPIKGLYDVFEFKDGLLMASMKLDNLPDGKGKPTESQVGRVRTDLGVIAHVVSTKGHSSAVTPSATPGTTKHASTGHVHGST